MNHERDQHTVKIESDALGTFLSDDPNDERDCPVTIKGVGRFASNERLEPEP